MLKISFPGVETEFLRNVARIAHDRFARRGGITGNLNLHVVSTLPSEEFEIFGEQNSSEITIFGGSEPAVLYGVGKLLRTAEYERDAVNFGSWRGHSRPAKKYRIAYLAAHFFNTYQVAPLDFLREYLEDLALLGYNYLALPEGSLHHYPNDNDAEFTENLQRIVTLYQLGQMVGMNAILFCNNIGFQDTPVGVWAKKTGRSFFGLEICPSKPAGMKLIIKNTLSVLERISGINPAFVNFWPYDQGGCGCDQCFPWGCNGYLNYIRELAPLYQEKFPGIKTIVGTWLFDHGGEAEWAGLYRAIASETSPDIEVILADSHGDFPEYPLNHGVPPGKEMISFPEISMYNRHPWGGFGANPLPERFSRIYGRYMSLVSGGMIYSEGIYEDFNKALFASFFWNGDNFIEEAVAEYCNYEFGINNSTEFSENLKIMERNHGFLIWWRRNPGWDNIQALKSKPVYATQSSYRRSEKAMTFFSQIVWNGSPWVKNNWKAKIFAIRAELDFLLDRNHGEPDSRCEELLEELFVIYRLDLQRSQRRIVPFTNRWLNIHKNEFDLSEAPNE